VTVTVPVDPDRAFRLLEDPRSIRALVAGARRIRRFDSRWPEEGSAIHHSVGVPPLVLRDVTRVTECDPGRRLVLEARLHLLGRLTIEFDLAPESGGSQSKLTVSEHPVGGPISLPGVTGLVGVAIKLRNAELARRFARLVAKREELAARAARNAPSSP
jgi:uncharacterized protein YndB with AHSA1/START domain